MVKEKAKTIELKADSNREFFLIHGYTGSPTDFNNLPEQLNKIFNANVKIIRLTGHGTKVEDLDNVSYNDLIEQIRKELRADILQGKQIIIGGVSLGALFALILASENNIRATFNVCPPYLLKFPFNTTLANVLSYYKKYWKKIEYQDEKMDKNKFFSYDFMHARGLRIVKQAKQKLKKRLGKIKCPVLTIHSYSDPIGHYDSANEINKKIKSSIKKSVIINNKKHNVFFSMNDKETYKEIIDFVKNNSLFEKRSNNKVAAIIPCLNEGARIKNVLKTLSETDIIDEIIVVDDGSTDNTEEVVKQFPTINYLKNKKNIGKANSMDRGIKSTEAEIIFFCDADLINFTSEIAKNIIKPVKNGDYNMFIGLRSNFMQSGVHLFAINSGERAIRRVVWERLPKYFKYKYRVEAGLNYYVNNYFGGFGYKKFNYSQTLKEKKYGFLKGTILRWSMNMDVLSAYLRDIVYNFFK